MSNVTWKSYSFHYKSWRALTTQYIYQVPDMYVDKQGIVLKAIGITGNGVGVSVLLKLLLFKQTLVQNVALTSSCLLYPLLLHDRCWELLLHDHLLRHGVRLAYVDGLRTGQREDCLVDGSQLDRHREGFIVLLRLTTDISIVVFFRHVAIVLTLAILRCVVIVDFVDILIVKEGLLYVEWWLLIWRDLMGWIVCACCLRVVTAMINMHHGYQIRQQTTRTTPRA